MSNETVPEAEAVLSKNVCPLIKGTYGFVLTQKCPYTYFSDLIIGEATCGVYVSDIFWREEVELLKQELERRFDVEITDEALRDAVRLRNRARRAFNKLYALQENTPPAMSGVEMVTTLLKSTFSFDVERFVESVENSPMSAFPPTRRGSGSFPHPPNASCSRAALRVA